MFGTSNVLLMTIEAKDGDLYSDPDIIKTVDRITIDLLHNVPGVNGEQVMSITHPKVKTTLTTGAGLKTVPLTYPRLPEDKEDLEFFRRKVNTTEGVRGFLVSQDDKATQIVAGFWEEYFDLAGMWKQVQDIVAREEAHGEGQDLRLGAAGVVRLLQRGGRHHGVVPAAAPWVMILLLLWFYFRTFQGLVIPTFSALLSAVWGLGFAGLFGFSLDPLVIVVFVLITARTLSHSVQSMERYHEEYFRCQDKHTAIMRSYISLYAPAMVSIIADGLAIMTIAVATIPLMQKLAFVSAFWIVSIFISVVTLHPIILSFVRPPKTHTFQQRLQPRRQCHRTAAGDARHRQHAVRRGGVLHRHHGVRGVLRAPAAHRRHLAGDGAALPGPPVQRRLRQGEPLLRRQQPAGHHRRRARSPARSRTRRHSTSSTSSSATWSRARAPAARSRRRRC